MGFELPGISILIFRFGALVQHCKPVITTLEASPLPIWSVVAPVVWALQGQAVRNSGVVE